MSRQTPLKVSALALLLSVLAYAIAWCAPSATKSLAFTDPAIPLTLEFLAATLRFWSAFAVGLSAVACVMTYFAFRETHASKWWKVAFWISGVFAMAILLPLAFLIWIFDKPVHIQNQALLRAINVDARILMAKKFVTTKTWSKDTDYEFESGDIEVRKAEWPRAIASLSPQSVTVSPSQAVDIMTTPFFDGGWGYRVQPGNKKPPEPEGRYEYLGEDVYAYHPY
ncbi:MAG: hypothetical protein WDM89_07565 [Rhizomicrobium sp.]